MKIILVGMSHRTAPLELRERLAVDDPGPLLQKLVSCEEIDEAALFSTCNRVEVVAVTRSLEAARLRLNAFLSRDLAGDAGDLSEYLYDHVDGDAVRHVLRVASSLDSMVVGEAQILGQVRESHRLAVEVGSIGPVLDRLFQTGLAAGKRVRSETDIGAGAVSVSSAGMGGGSSLGCSFSS